MNEDTISRYAESRPDVWLLYQIYQRMGAIENLLTMIWDVREKPTVLPIASETVKPAAAKRKPAAKRTPAKRTTTKKG